MRYRCLLALSLPALFIAPGVARADGDGPPMRIGVLPTVGLGVATVSNASPFPSVIGLTTLGGEVHVEMLPYGAFFRFQYHSSGPDGHWTAPSFALGGTYRIAGDGITRVGILARGGLLWERWHATNGNCPVDFFVPTNCKALTPQAPSGVILNEPSIVSVTADTFGLFGGLRAEMPLTKVYVAFDAEASGVVDVGSSFPGSVIALRIALTLGFRDTRGSEDAVQGPSGPGPRQQRRY
jgi:hypothetical protein